MLQTKPFFPCKKVKGKAQKHELHGLDTDKSTIPCVVGGDVVSCDICIIILDGDDLYLVIIVEEGEHSDSSYGEQSSKKEKNVHHHP